jgi:hypothetical protein
MKKMFVSPSGLFNRRVLAGLVFCLTGVFLASAGLGQTQNHSPSSAVPSTHVARTAQPLSAMPENRFESQGEANATIPVPATRSTFMARWDSVPGALGYWLDVSTSSSFNSYVTGYQDLNVGNVSGRVVTGLSKGTTYYYRVRTYNASGTSDCSNVMTATTEASAGLIFDVSFDSAIQNRPDIQGMITRSISILESLFSNSMTIKIHFRYSTTQPNGTPLGPTDLELTTFCFAVVPWSTYINALINHQPVTSNDMMAIASLSDLIANPPSTNIQIKDANGRAVGLVTPPQLSADGRTCGGGAYDAIVTINSAQPFKFTRPPGNNFYDAQRSTEHEIDEVMGLGALIGGPFVNYCFMGDLQPQDLFSWSSPNTRNRCISGTRYFSINSGSTNIVNFNQLSCPADFGDWEGSPSDTCQNISCPQINPYVQNAFACSDQYDDVTGTAPEGINLDVIGYDLVTAAASPTPTPTAGPSGTPTPPPGCLVVNPGFETGNFSGWTQSGDTSFTTVSNIMNHSGSFAAQLGPLTEAFLSQTITTVVGQTYNVTFWLADDAAGPPNDFSASFAGVSILSIVNDPSGFPYTLYSANITATSTSSVLQFAFSNEAAYWHLDDVCVAAGAGGTPTPTATATATATPTVTVTPMPTATPHAMPVKADFNGDGNSDILWQNRVTGDRVIWLMNDHQQIISDIYLPPVAPEWQIASSADFDRNGQVDILGQNRITGDRVIWLMNETQQIGEVPLPRIDPAWQIVGAGDFDGDGQVDILWRDNNTAQRVIWLMNGIQPIRDIYLPLVAPEWQIVGTGDFNENGKVDILWQSANTGQRVIWFLDGTETVNDFYLPPVAPEWQVGGTGDFDRNGQVDILGQNRTTGDRVIWLMNGFQQIGEVPLPRVGPEWEMRNY